MKALWTKWKRPLVEIFNFLMGMLALLPALVSMQKLLLPYVEAWHGVAALSPLTLAWFGGRLLRKKDKELALTIGAVLGALLTVPAVVIFSGSIEAFAIIFLILVGAIIGFALYLIAFIYGPHTPSAKVFVAGLILYVLALVLPNNFSEAYSAALNSCAIVLLIVTLFLFNIKGLIDATNPSGEGKARMPKGMKRSNMLILGFFVVLAVALANITAIKDAAVSAGVWIVDRVMELLLFLANMQGAPTGEGEATYGDGGMDLSGLVTEVPEESALQALLWKIFLYVLIAAIIVVVCYLLYRLIRKLMGRFAGLLDRLLGRVQQVDEGFVDETEDIDDEASEKNRGFFSRIRERFTRKPKFGDMPTPRAKVRFAMREFLREHPAVRAATPSELVPELAKTSSAHAEAFADAYERARYTDDGSVSESDAEIARQLVEKL